MIKKLLHSSTGIGKSLNVVMQRHSRHAPARMWLVSVVCRAWVGVVHRNWSSCWAYNAFRVFFFLAYSSSVMYNFWHSHFFTTASIWSLVSIRSKMIWIIVWFLLKALFWIKFICLSKLFWRTWFENIVDMFCSILKEFSLGRGFHIAFAMNRGTGCFSESLSNCKWLE